MTTIYIIAAIFFILMATALYFVLKSNAEFNRTYRQDLEKYKKWFANDHRENK